MIYSVGMQLKQQITTLITGGYVYLGHCMKEIGHMQERTEDVIPHLVVFISMPHAQAYKYILGIMQKKSPRRRFFKRSDLHGLFQRIVTDSFNKDWIEKQRTTFLDTLM